MSTVRYIRNPTPYRGDIRRLLVANDENFVPPLTASERAEMSRASDQSGPTDIDSYVSACLDRPMIGAFDDGRLVGFASFEPVVDSEPLAAFTPTNYLAVLVVDEPYRNQGLATEFYGYLFDSLPPGRQLPTVSTRTWSTNEAHLAILDRLGFECVHRITDDRAPGVDTVYYARTVQ